MSFVAKFRFHLRSLFARKKLDDQLSEEVRTHVEMATEANVAKGMSPKEARNAALREFGNVGSIQERAREERGWMWLHHFFQDLLYAGRQLRKDAGFTTTVMVTLALAIGACTAVFSVVDAILLRPFSRVAEPERQLRIYETFLPRTPEASLSVPTLLDVREQARSFEAIGAMRTGNFILTGEGEPLRLNARRVSTGIFDTFGFKASLGRIFLPEDEIPGKGNVIFLRYQLWQTVFGSDPNIIGRKVQVNGQPCTVVGISTPDWGEADNSVDALVPLIFTDEERKARGARNFSVMTRLKPGVTAEQAQAELNLLAEQIARQYPDTNKGWGLTVLPNLEHGARTLRTILWTLLGAVGCVLLVACANVANLLLARANARQREMAVRAALGAGRGRLVRQLLTESILLAALGGAAGLLVAQWALVAVHAYASAPGMARFSYVGLNPGMLTFALGLSLATGIVFGLAPAWLGSATDLNETLKQGTRGNSEGGFRGRLRGALVVLEVAGTLMLLVGAGLLLRSFVQLSRTDPGFTPGSVTTMQLNLSDQQYAKPDSRNAFAAALLERLCALPGVEAAAVASALPPTLSAQGDFAPEGRVPATRSEWPSAAGFTVSPDYFATLGIKLVRGRLFGPQDSATAPKVLVISETLARQYFPGEDPLGRRLNVAALGAADSWREIVGIVGDVATGPAAEPFPLQIYRPFAQNASPNFYALVRTGREAAAVVGALLKAQVYAVDKNQPVTAVRALSGFMDTRVATQQFTLHLITLFGLIALVIAAVGIYGVIAYHVSQRTTEIGIRMALGAQMTDVLQLVLGHGVRLVGLGLALGLVGSVAAGRAIESMLVRVSAHDPLTLGAITLLLAAVAALACLLPARRATQVDPMIALRAE